jgi:DNA repair protein RecN (Recombination protein N)
VNDEPAGRLLELAVADLALIDRLRLELGPGLNVITGETGAGKSLLIDALGLALGARADSGLVRHGATSTRVEALFDRGPEPLIVVREVAAEGRSTARLDDEPVTAARLAETVGGLVEIHGQHDQQRLLDERAQRDLLDAYGGAWVAREAVAAGVERWRANRAALAELTADPRELLRRVELAEHEAAEIAAARLRPGEAEEIRTRLGASRHAETIVRGGAAIHEALVGEGSGPEGTTARERIGAAVHAARDLARLDPRFEPLVDRLAGLEAELEDVVVEVRGLVEDLEHDPAVTARLEERLSLIYALERRYGDDESAVLAHAEAMTAEADHLRGLEASRERRAAEDAALLGEIARAAATLSGLRATAAGSLAAAVTAALEGLGFERVRFEVGLGRRPAARDEPAVEVDGDALAFDASGIDEVVFRFAPNPGEPARPLARIASGGELSRVALAIKEVLAAADATPTLVFDEIDSGIGGRSADPVGRSLWTLARRHQVLCVTHLPQIAAHADVHFRIAKRVRDGRTITEVHRLDDETERVGELAQMLGGREGGAAARAGARELLDRVVAWRQGIGGGEPAIPA